MADSNLQRSVTTATARRLATTTKPALRALGYEMSVRPTFALYNTREDVDKLVIALRKIVGERQR